MYVDIESLLRPQSGLSGAPLSVHIAEVMLGFGTALPGSQPIPLHRLGVVLGGRLARNVRSRRRRGLSWPAIFTPGPGRYKMQSRRAETNEPLMFIRIDRDRLVLLTKKKEARLGISTWNFFHILGIFTHFYKFASCHAETGIDHIRLTRERVEPLGLRHPYDHDMTDETTDERSHPTPLCARHA